MQDYITWGALLLAGGSIVTVIKFWIDIGRAQEGGKANVNQAKQRAEDAAETARLATAQYSLLAEKLNNFKVEAARTYATIKSLSDTEAQLAKGFSDAIQGIYQRLDAMTTRLDSLITITKSHNNH